MTHIPAQRPEPDARLQIDDLPAFLAQFEQGGPLYDEDPAPPDEED